MYEKFYGFHAKPFQLNPDPDFYFASSQHQRAKAYLDYGVMRNEGFVVITGDVGAGKTTLVRGLLESFEDASIVAAQLVSTQLEADDLLRAVGAAFGVRVKGVSKSELLMALEVFLVSQAGAGKRCLLIVDEAQNLSLGALEELRMLSNFQFGKHSLLQSFLVGQPEFREKLNHSALLQLRQRIIAACHIGPLNIAEVEQYIRHRIKCAGGSDSITFEEGIYTELLGISGGIPRNINFVMDRLLLQGFLENVTNFGISEVMALRHELQKESGNFQSLPVFLASDLSKLVLQNQSEVDRADFPGFENCSVDSRLQFLWSRNLHVTNQLDEINDRLGAIENSSSELLNVVERLDNRRYNDS